MNLVVEFRGMVLLGYGSRGEGWLVDTSKVQVPTHVHSHTISWNGGTQSDTLSDGALVWFEDGERRLEGRLQASEKFRACTIDVDVLLPGARLHPALRTADPETDRKWQDLLAAWIRLPAGELRAGSPSSPRVPAVWAFHGPRCDVRLLTDRFTFRASDQVREPYLVIARGAQATRHRLQSPSVSVHTDYVGETNSAPEPGDVLELEEVQLIYGCLQGHASPPVPRTVWSHANSRNRSPNSVTHPDTLCPGGTVSLD
jgi:hypothetical protein